MLIFFGVAGVMAVYCPVVEISAAMGAEWAFIISYDIWNFCRAYNNLPTRSWYAGIILVANVTALSHIVYRAKKLHVHRDFRLESPTFSSGTRGKLPTRIDDSDHHGGT